MPTEKQEQTLGERRVRVSFNPYYNSVVSQIKQKTAELIDLVSAIPVANGPSEKGRLIAIAQTKYEEAAMWAVKATTSE